MQTVTAILDELQALAAKPLEEATAPPKALYTSPEILALEQSRIFNRSWQCAGRADEIQAVGDYMCFELGPQPVIVIRDQDGTVHARANVCRHRMMRLAEGRGNTRKFTCPYHAWTYNLQGELLRHRIWIVRPVLRIQTLGLPQSDVKSFRDGFI